MRRRGMMQILGVVAGVVVFTGGWWLGGVPYPMARGMKALLFAGYTVFFGFIGWLIANLIADDLDV